MTKRAPIQGRDSGVGFMRLLCGSIHRDGISYQRQQNAKHRVPKSWLPFVWNLEAEFCHYLVDLWNWQWRLWGEERRPHLRAIPITAENHIHEEMCPIHLRWVGPMSQVMPELVLFLHLQRIVEGTLVFKRSQEMGAVRLSRPHHLPTECREQATCVEKIRFHDLQTDRSVSRKKPAKADFLIAVLAGDFVVMRWFCNLNLELNLIGKALYYHLGQIER